MMWAKLLRPFWLGLLLLVSAYTLGAQQQNDLRTLSWNEMSDLLESKSKNFDQISTSHSLNWDQRLNALEALATELEPLWDSLETIEKDSSEALMMVSGLRTKLTSLSAKVDGAISSLKSIEDEVKKAKNRATWGIIAGGTALAVAVGVCIFVGIKAKQQPD